MRRTLRQSGAGRWFAPWVFATACVLGILLVSLAPTASTRANPTYLAEFRAAYPFPRSSLTYDIETATGSACFTCHNSNAFLGDWNCYRRDLIARLRLGRTIREAISDIEFVDSDGDGVLNIDEITRPREGGSIGFDPGLVGPRGVDPCLTISFNDVPGSSLAVSGRLETPPPNASIGACCSGTTCVLVPAAACVGGAARFDGAGACNTSGNVSAPCCIADFNQSGDRTLRDLFDFLGAWFALIPSTDTNRSGSVEETDIFDYVNAWFIGC